MNFLQRKTSWSNNELGLLKICIGSIGIVAGVYFHKYLEGYLVLFIALYFITGIYLFKRWYKQLTK